VQRLPTVGQQFFDQPGRVSANSIEHIAEVSLRVDIRVRPVKCI
jgi:hypothetical protein